MTAHPVFDGPEGTVSQTESGVYAGRGKDACPENTVRDILACLDRAGLKTVYEEFLGDVADLCSSRVSLDSPAACYFGTNGKGLSSAFTKASAYGELMERLQNITFASRIMRNDPDSESIVLGGSRTADIAEDELSIPARRIVERIEAGLSNLLPMFRKKEVMRELLSSLCPGKNSTRSPLLPFWSLREEKTVMIPECLLMPFIMSNGLAAGNTLEEATVQAISEIFERYAAERFLSGEATPPEIPRSRAERYPEIARILSDMEASGRYKVMLCDCSMGKGLPVVAGVIFDREKASLGIKFGAHPHMRVALERIFTESMQGATSEVFCSRSRISYPKAGDNISLNTWNHIKVGVGFVPDRFFAREPDYAFKDWPETEGLSNRDLARAMLKKLDGMSGGVYIRDASFMGFPAVAVYAEEFSEVFPVNLDEIKKIRLSRLVSDIFAAGIAGASEEDVKKIERLIRLKSASLIENSFRDITGLYSLSPLPGGSRCAVPFLRAACLFRLGRFDESGAVLSHLCETELASGEDARFLRAASLYVNGIAADKPREHIERLVRLSVPKDTADRVISAFSDKERVLAELYPPCSADCAGCSTPCLYPEVKRIYRLLYGIRNSCPVDPQRVQEMCRGITNQQEEVLP